MSQGREAAEPMYHLYLRPGVFFRPNGPGGVWTGAVGWRYLGAFADADAAERLAQRESADGLVRVYEVRGGRIEWLSEWVEGDALAHEGYDGIDAGPLDVSPDRGCVVVEGDERADAEHPGAALVRRLREPGVRRDLLARIDWPLLRVQKAWLAAQDGDEAAGLVALLDDLMDAAALQLGEAAVFGSLDDE